MTIQYDPTFGREVACYVACFEISLAQGRIMEGSVLTSCSSPQLMAAEKEFLCAQIRLTAPVYTKR